MLKVGDILCEHWGYSMTLYNFYRVNKVTASFATLDKLRKVCLNNDPGHLEVFPAFNEGVAVSAREKPIRRKLSGDLVDAVWTGNGIAKLWDGKSQFEDHMD